MKGRQLLKRVAIDGLGYICIIAAPFLAPLPGPGGTPLLLAGFGLLSINNKWAKKTLQYLKTEGLRLAEIVFPNHRLIAFLWDVVFVVLVAGAAIIYRDNQGFIAMVTVSLALAVALYILTLNRKRVERLIRRLKTHKINKK